MVSDYREVIADLLAGGPVILSTPVDKVVHNAAYVYANAKVSGPDVSNVQKAWGYVVRDLIPYGDLEYMFILTTSDRFQSAFSAVYGA